MIGRLEVVPSAIAATAPPCRRCRRLRAKAEILCCSALSKAQYRARFRPIKLLFAHHSAPYAAKGPAHEDGMPRGDVKPGGNNGTNAKRPGSTRPFETLVRRGSSYFAAVGKG